MHIDLGFFNIYYLKLVFEKLFHRSTNIMKSICHPIKYFKNYLYFSIIFQFQNSLSLDPKKIIWSPYFLTLLVPEEI